MFTAPWVVWILGLGPGALGPALDGGWLRLLAETGIVGTFAFLFMLRKISNLDRACVMAVLALAANMVMVDSQNAYKVMAFLFLMAGVSVQRSILESHGRKSAADLREAD
jgi:proteasome assembly chaperone (PAC2) family protein